MCVCVAVVQARSLEYNVCDRPTVTIEHNVRCCCFVIFFVGALDTVAGKERDRIRK